MYVDISPALRQADLNSLKCMEWAGMGKNVETGQMIGVNRTYRESPILSYMTRLLITLDIGGFEKKRKMTRLGYCSLLMEIPFYGELRLGERRKCRVSR